MSNNIEIPYPENPQHVDNLLTIPLLEAQGFQGLDESLEISLFDQGFAWREIPENLRQGADDHLFVFGVEDEKFARASAASSNFESDVSWMSDKDRSGILAFLGVPSWEFWLSRPYPDRMHDMVTYFGYMNVFGSSPGLVFEIRDPQKDYGSRPMPGESPDEYYDRLLGGDDSGEPWIPTDFVRDEDGVWFVSPTFGEWMCHWHSGMDCVYAVGSSVIANHKVPLDVLSDAIMRMAKNAGETEAAGRAHDAAEARVLVGIMKAALNARPSEEPQQANL